MPQTLVSVKGWSQSYPELGQHIPSLNILSSKTDLPVGIIFISLKISKRNLKYPVFQSLRGNLFIIRAHPEKQSQIWQKEQSGRTHTILYHICNS